MFVCYEVVLGNLIFDTFELCCVVGNTLVVVVFIVGWFCWLG